MPKHICFRPGCCNRADYGDAYCAKCKAKRADETRAYDRDRNANDPLRAMYNSIRWTRGTRLEVLRRDPLCVAEGCGNKASPDVDHHPLGAREIVARYGVNEFYNPARCRGVCHSCHS